MDYGNAARFLKSYNKIESQLKILYNARPTQNFTDLVKRCTDLNITVRRYENELVDYGKLRNAIVHRAAEGELFIANPCDDVVSNIEFIEKQLCDPPAVLDALKSRKLPSVFADKPLSAAAEQFAEHRRKTLVVSDHGRTAGLIDCYALLGDLAALSAKGEDVNAFLSGTLCGEYCARQGTGSCLFLSAEATVFDVFEAFERQKGLSAVLITQTGDASEKVKLMITPTDFPAINRYLEACNAKPC